MNESLGLIHYDAMLREIAICEEIDEVKELRDKALALQVYAKQAMNVEAERRCAGVRIRAEIKAGEILSATEKAKGGEHGGRGKIDGDRAAPSNPTPTLSDLGISKGQSSRWQKLAKVPQSVIDDALNDGGVPSTAGILKKANGTLSKMDPKALWVWGRVRDFEKEVLSIAPGSIAGELTEGMQSDVRRIVPALVDWLTEFSDALE